MFDLTTRFLASVFLDAQSIATNTENTVNILEKVLRPRGDVEWIHIPILESPQSGASPRMGFTSLSGEWQLILASTRFDLTKRLIDPKQSNMGEFSDFCKRAYPILNDLLVMFERKGHRLSAVQEGLLPVMSEAKMQAIAMRLLKLSPTFSSSPPFEWDWRVASLIKRPVAKRMEPTNTIVTIKRLAVKTGDREDTEPVDRIRVDLDINTSHKKTTVRFGKTEVTAFFKSIGSWHSQLVKEVSSFLGVEGRYEYESRKP